MQLAYSVNSLLDKSYGDKRPLTIFRYGNDGPWSTFMLGYGTPAQFVHSLVSTSITQPYVVLDQGCTSLDPSDCAQARGVIFSPNSSSTWQNLGDYTLAFEQNLGIYENGQFGMDTVSLGLPGSGAPTMDHQIVTGIATKSFFVGSWGIRPAPTNLTNFNDPVPSLVQNLKDGGKISSLSWAYTAGAYYQSQSELDKTCANRVDQTNTRAVSKAGEASLTIGGYDTSRFQDNNVTFDFSTDTARDIELAIHAIVTADGSNSLLSEPILTFIDSAVSHIWLPIDSCEAFQRTFNLTYDQNLELYLVNDTVHQTLIAQNATISFTLGNDITLSSSDSLVTIDMPYSAFDLQLTPDYPNNTNNATYYFPIRQAANASQYTLGRTFLQEAYLIADYERKQFSVHQAVFPDTGVQQDLQIIQPLSTNSSNVTTIPSPVPSSGSSISTGALAGIIVAAIIVVLGALAGGFWLYRRKKHRPLAVPPESAQPAATELLTEEKKRELVSAWELNGRDGPKPVAAWELNGRDTLTPELSSPNGAHLQRSELRGEEMARELESPRTPRPLYEMSG